MEGMTSIGVSYKKPADPFSNLLLSKGKKD